MKIPKNAEEVLLLARSDYTRLLTGVMIMGRILRKHEGIYKAEIERIDKEKSPIPVSRNIRSVMVTFSSFNEKVGANKEYSSLYKTYLLF